MGLLPSFLAPPELFVHWGNPGVSSIPWNEWGLESQDTLKRRQVGAQVMEQFLGVLGPSRGDSRLLPSCMGLADECPNAGKLPSIERQLRRRLSILMDILISELSMASSSRHASLRMLLFKPCRMPPWELAHYTHSQLIACEISGQIPGSSLWKGQESLTHLSPFRHMIEHSPKHSQKTVEIGNGLASQVVSIMLTAGCYCIPDDC